MVIAADPNHAERLIVCAMFAADEGAVNTAGYVSSPWTIAIVGARPPQKAPSQPILTFTGTTWPVWTRSLPPDPSGGRTAPSPTETVAREVAESEPPSSSATLASSAYVPHDA